MAKSCRDYLAHPRSVKQLSAEIKRAVDDYWGRELPESELRAYLWQVAAQGKLLRGPEVNPTVRQIVGAKRLELVVTLLQGYQHTFKL